MGSVCCPDKDPWGDYYWQEMPWQYREAWTILGYNQYTWDEGQQPPACNGPFAALTPQQQRAAMALGYTPYMWDNDKDPKPLPDPSTIQLGIEMATPVAQAYAAPLIAQPVHGSQPLQPMQSARELSFAPTDETVTAAQAFRTAQVAQAAPVQQATATPFSSAPVAQAVPAHQPTAMPFSSAPVAQANAGQQAFATPYSSASVAQGVPVQHARAVPFSSAPVAQAVQQDPEKRNAALLAAERRAEAERNRGIGGVR